MAKSKTIDELINELLKNYKVALNEAVEYASDKAVEDIYKYSQNCLQEYYENYDPTSYNRSDSLWRAILPYLKIINNRNEIISRVGVEYNPFVLEAYVAGNPAYSGSKAYTPVDGYYVLDNFLEGIHPATNGSRNLDDVVYFEIIDTESPTDKMEKYLNQYASTTFHNNILISFAKQILNM